MICPYCGNAIPVNSESTFQFTVYQVNFNNTDQKGEVEVCGRCFLLISILDTIKGIRDGNDRRS
jgi:hypothetical protein